MNHLKLFRSAAQSFLGTVLLALLTIVCFRLQVNSTTVALLYLIVIVLMSLTGGFVSSAVASIIAYFCLDYFFTAPRFQFMHHTLDFVAPIAFLTTSFVITRLMSKLRKSGEDRKRAEETLRKSQADLAHLTRVMTMGELAASIAHEINQPLAAIVNNGSACLRWLAGDPPNLEEARQAAREIVRDGNRAGEVITRIRALLRKTETEKTRLGINQTIQDVVLLTQKEAVRKGVELRLELAADLPPVLGDRVQLQQVILNLAMNGVEAMASVTGRPRELLISSRQHASDRCSLRCETPVLGSTARISKGCSAHFTQPRRKGWAWGWRSAAPSLRITAGAYGRNRMTPLPIRAAVLLRQPERWVYVQINLMVWVIYNTASSNTWTAAA